MGSGKGEEIRKDLYDKQRALATEKDAATRQLKALQEQLATERKDADDLRTELRKARKAAKEGEIHAERHTAAVAEASAKDVEVKELEETNKQAKEKLLKKGEAMKAAEE